MIIAIIIYVLMGVITYGGNFAYYQRKYSSIAEEEYREDMRHAIYLALIPIAGFVATLIVSGFYKHGFKFW